MDISSASAFAVAMLVLAASPGPGVLAVTARSMTAGFGAACAMAAGMVLGDLVFLLLAVHGLAAAARAMGSMFTFVKYAGAAYLIYLGLRLLLSRPAVENRPASPIPNPRTGRMAGFCSGSAITLGNPKVIVFYLGFLPTFMDLHAMTPGDVLTASCIVATVLGAVLTGYAWAADRARSMLTKSAAVTRMNRTAGGVTAAAGVVLALRN